MSKNALKNVNNKNSKVSYYKAMTQWNKKIWQYKLTIFTKHNIQKHIIDIKGPKKLCKVVIEIFRQNFKKHENYN